MGKRGKDAPLRQDAGIEWLVLAEGGAALTAAMLRQLLEHWQDLCRDRALPSRADLDPAAMKPLLPYVYLVDVSHRPLRFRYRLVGTALVEFTGRDVTGKFVDEATYGAAAAPIYRLFELVVETRGPVGGRGRTVWIQGGEWREVESLVLPMSRDGAEIDMLLAGYVTVGRSNGSPEPGATARHDRLEIIPLPRFDTA
jgi:hypothetical protein